MSTAVPPSLYNQDPASRQPPLITYGPLSNCTLSLCSPKFSVYEYRPSLATNVTFLALFGTALLLHVLLGVRWRSWFFMSMMVMGCVSEMIGYGGRILLWENPFGFAGFLVQIICITLGPTWFTAGVYVTLSKIVVYLGPQYGRFSPKLYYWIFIPCDIFSLCLQAVGGALSSTSSGSSDVAVDVSKAGLSFQVFTLVVFIALTVDYAVRYMQAKRVEERKTPLPVSFKVFVAFLSLAVVLILIRCAYRIDELSDGYSGPLIHNQGLFIGLEGVMIIVAVFCLAVAHPGPVFARQESEKVGHISGEPKTGLEQGTGVGQAV